MAARTAGIVKAVAVGAVIAAAIAVGAVALVSMNVTGEKRFVITPIAPVDPLLLTWREAARFSSGFGAPRGVAAAGGRIYVAGDSEVRVFDGSGGRVAGWQLPDAASCVTVAGERVLVGVGRRVIAYDLDGTVLTEWPALGKQAYVTSVAVAGEDVFAADATRRAVARLVTDGAVAGWIEGEDGFVLPSGYFDVAVAPDGSLRIANPGLMRIEAYARDGRRLFHWGRPAAEHDGVEAFLECCNPSNVAFAPGGRIVTAEKGLAPAKVKVFEPDGPYTHIGTVESVVATAGDFADPGVPLDVAVDAAGRVVVLVLAPDGEVRIHERKTPTTAPGE